MTTRPRVPSGFAKSSERREVAIRIAAPAVNIDRTRGKVTNLGPRNSQAGWSHCKHDELEQFQRTQGKSKRENVFIPSERMFGGQCVDVPRILKMAGLLRRNEARVVLP
jgi:hypothetical protein